jgi:hypothetical protein
MPGIFIHIPGIGIHILPEFLFTSLRNPYSHAPEYAGKRRDHQTNVLAKSSCAVGSEA